MGWIYFLFFLRPEREIVYDYVSMAIGDTLNKKKVVKGNYADFLCMKLLFENSNFEPCSKNIEFCVDSRNY